MSVCSCCVIPEMLANRINTHIECACLEFDTDHSADSAVSANKRVSCLKGVPTAKCALFCEVWIVGHHHCKYRQCISGTAMSLGPLVLSREADQQHVTEHQH
jgi:dihydrodipicolinate reductase